ncbi:1-Phosphofructokinase [Ignavibacterium album JCM 16511]|uniref:1-Phosphofructokinase n=1 Tax=Ignavibacterium album (strain DSM 19864 / JCM 16511 / NBRC 101810 / Mat9-16) TaxID=945713 RepID=I0AH82_IGNAJ|nr:1-phosphofructokinase family hexose kinase [Ignavibacterium album]AFH48339.1 1-Phosphofructokinase [Ignavibacterium album JCM 16511]
MILIITLNPLLERRFYYSQIFEGKVNRNGKIVYQAGGKGINVSRQLKKFSIDSYNLFFSGGNDGKIFRDTLKEEELQFTSVHIDDETRQAAVIISQNDKKVTSFFSENPELNQKEVAEMKSRIEKMIVNCEMVVISGSSPSPVAEEIVPFTIRLANELDKISVCDYYGKNLYQVLESSPTILHNNIEETENSLNLRLKSETEIKNFLDSLYQKGIKRVFITNGANDFYAQNFDYVYKISPPKVNSIDSTGSGDAFVAGIIYTWKGGMIFEDSLKFASACGAANAESFEVCRVTLENVFRLMDKVRIESVGKKMKIIDDSPHQE